MVRTLSIRPTALLKFVLSPLWIGGAAWAMWLLAMHPERALGDYAPGTAIALQWFFLALLAASLVLVFAFAVPLKRVRLAPDGLRVSNYRREITIPFDAIASVRQNWLPTFRLVTLHLRTDTPFGRRLVFMPAVPRPMAFWRADYWREDALVRELRSLAGLPMTAASGAGQWG